MSDSTQIPDRILQVAKNLIQSLNAPPQFHSIWIKTDVDPESKTFVWNICASVYPGHENKIMIPDEFEGFKITKMEWPKRI